MLTIQRLLDNNAKTMAKLTTMCTKCGGIDPKCMACHDCTVCKEKLKDCACPPITTVPMRMRSVPVPTTSMMAMSSAGGGIVSSAAAYSIPSLGSVSSTANTFTSSIGVGGMSTIHGMGGVGGMSAMGAMGGMGAMGAMGGLGGIGTGINTSMGGLGDPSAGMGASMGGGVYGMGGPEDGGMKGAGERSDILQLAEVLKNLAANKGEGEHNKADANQRSRLPIPKFYEGSALNFHILLRNWTTWSTTCGLSNQLQLYNLVHHANLS